MSGNYKVSYCVGVYNEQKILTQNLQKLDQGLKSILGGGNYEIVVIDNGSTDKTFELLKSFTQNHIKKVKVDQKGYGIAFSKAFEVSKYNHFVFSAIDLPFGFSDLLEVLPIWQNYDVIFGSKAHPDSKVKRDFKRKFFSSGYRLLMNFLFANKVKDTQGSVFLQKNKVNKIINKITSSDAFFSGQLAIYAQRSNLKVKEVPVELKEDNKDRLSRYKMISDSAAFFKQIIKEFFKVYKISTKSVILGVGLVFLLSLASFSFTKGLNLYFWRDDWTAFWFLENNPKFFFFNWVLPSRHPGEAFATFPWYYLFKTNHIYWQLGGVFLKALGAVSVGLIAYTFIRKKASIYLATVFFASGFIGMESFTWTSARLSGILLPFLALCIYYFDIGLSKKKLNLLTFLLYLIIVIMEPGRGVFFGGLLILWQILRTTSFKKEFLSIFRNIIYLSIGTTLGLLLTTYGRSLLGIRSIYYSPETNTKLLSGIFSVPLVKNYFSSLSNFYFGVFNNFDNTNIHFKYAVLLTIIIVAIALYLILKKHKNGKVLLFSCLWILVFYFPSWLSDASVTVAANHRYFTLPSVGVYLIMAIALEVFPTKIKWLLASLIMILSLSTGQKYIKQEYEIRGYEISYPLLKSQEASVPAEFNGGIFIVEGSNSLRGYVFDWSYGGGLPFALARNISNPLKVPVGMDKSEAWETLCGEKKQKYYLDNYIKLTPPVFRVTDLYSWKISDGGKIIETTTDLRSEFVNTGCVQK